MSETKNQLWSELSEIRGPGLLTVVSSFGRKSGKDLSTLSETELIDREVLLYKRLERKRAQCNDLLARWNLCQEELMRRQRV